MSLTRNAVASTCGAAKTVPWSIGRRPTLGFEAYTFATCPATPSSCAQVSLAAPSGSSQQLFSTAYNGSFNPSRSREPATPAISVETHTDGAFAGYGVDPRSRAVRRSSSTSARSRLARRPARRIGLRVAGMCLASCTRNRVPVAQRARRDAAGGIGGFATRNVSTTDRSIRTAIR